MNNWYSDDPYDYISNTERSYFEHEMSLFSDYLESMTKFLEGESELHQESIQQFVDSAPDEIFDWSPVAYEQYRLEIITEFSSTLYYSYFVTLFSYLENKLVKECKRRQNEKKILLAFSDIAGQNDVEKAKVYFKKVLQTPFPSSSIEWEAIQKHKMVRNCIVHQRGIIDDLKQDDKLQAYLKKKNLLNDNKITLNQEYCKEVTDTIRKFLFQVLSQPL